MGIKPGGGRQVKGDEKRAGELRRRRGEDGLGAQQKAGWWAKVESSGLANV